MSAGRVAGVFAPRLALALATAAVASLALVPHPIGFVNDDLDHFAAFALLTALATRALPSASSAALLIASLFCGAGLEALQLLPAIGRSAELSDWASGALGALAGVSTRRTLPVRSRN